MLAVLGALPRVEALWRDTGFDEGLRKGEVATVRGQLARYLKGAASIQLGDEAGAARYGRPLEFAALARLLADALPLDGCARAFACVAEWACTSEWATAGDDVPHAAAPAGAHIAAALAGANLARRILGNEPALAGDAAAALRSARVFAGLVELAAAAPGTAEALWAAGSGLETLRDAARGACGAAAAPSQRPGAADDMAERFRDIVARGGAERPRRGARGRAAHCGVRGAAAPSRARRRVLALRGRGGRARARGRRRPGRGGLVVRRGLRQRPAPRGLLVPLARPHPASLLVRRRAARRGRPRTAVL
jgi:hypothetical protein